MSLADVPVKNPRIAARVVDGKAIMVSIDKRQLHTLNGVGTRVWELCEGRTAEQIAEALVTEFEVEREVALADVLRFVRELRGAGALLPEEAAT